MRIFETKAEAMRVAERLLREHRGAGMDDGEVSFCGMQDGRMVERKFRTIEVCYEEYDSHEGWVDHSIILAYKS